MGCIGTCFVDVASGFKLKSARGVQVWNPRSDKRGKQGAGVAPDSRKNPKHDKF